MNFRGNTFEAVLWIFLAGLLFAATLFVPAIGMGAEMEFDEIGLAFEGAAADQAGALLRPVKKWGRLGEPLTRLPAGLEGRPGKPCGIRLKRFRDYLAAKGISEQDLGGPLDRPVSHAWNGSPDEAMARYFVIHDTSTPNYGDKPFPQNIDEAGWKYNRLSIWQKGTKSRAHVFVNRVGESVTAVDFEVPWRATRFELGYVNLAPKGLFLHVEMVQPRRRDQAGGSKNDALAPEPGFTPDQYERLALVYAAASFRQGAWLIPAFHAALDAGISGAHDDPQNFSLDSFAREVEALSHLLD